MTSSTKPVHIVGGGLAGSEAAWQLAQAGVPVVLHEMRPVRGTEAHLTETLAELVCSNSFRSDDAANNAVGVIHEEMRRAGSLIMRSADAHKLPAGGALAVDRHGFSAAVQETLLAHPLVTLEREEVAGLPPEDWDSVIVATGPLTAPSLAEAIAKLTGEDSLAFFDAIAPIVHYESIDQSIAWKQSRYDKVGPGNVEGSDGADYFNCPMDKPQYEAFVAALLAGEKTEFKQWEHNTPYFQGCQPIEVIASTGPQSLRFGPMKPVGLRDPRTGHRPWAVVQLRQDNALGTLWNIVGFQTKLKHGEQTRIFRAIPGLEKAEFARLGRPFVKALRLQAAASIALAGTFSTPHLLLDAPAGAAYGGTGTLSDLALAEECVRRHPALHIILAGGLNPENVGAAVKAVRPCAVDVASGVEMAGDARRKCASRMERFLAAARPG